ncbi:hypothetical protein RHMOL_Rhmol07G0182800 [Rhododendron molle]|uniref:Uncharacterized protein n=1 Tax=Rhododendron molle TaxID=49168 RepID=A0ACC0N353_RHOML|nr:hypothetical protein RHMOL_Rhmol07G0182800 [Rhododendron molle]
MNEEMINRLRVSFAHTTPLDNDSPPSNQIINGKNLVLSRTPTKKLTFKGAFVFQIAFQGKEVPLPTYATP